MPADASIFIVGPTASGKSALAIQLAEMIGGEIVCSDSQTLRKGLNIGTAKPSSADQSRVPHHMLDIIEPYERYSVAQFSAAAEKCIADIQSRGRVPIVVGGSGLYIDSLFFNYTFSLTQFDSSKFERMTVEELQTTILDSGLTLPKNASNPRHLIGVLRRGNETAADRRSPRTHAYIFGLQWTDEELKKRISQRVDAMLITGLLDEVKALLAIYGEPPTKLDAIAYPIMAHYLNGQISLEKAKELLKRADWQYARKQKAWFKRNPFIHWLAPKEQLLEEIVQYITSR